jgi:hypothetical protein
MELRAEQEWLDRHEETEQGVAGENDVEDASAAGVFKRLKEVPADVARAHDWDLAAWHGTWVS